MDALAVAYIDDVLVNRRATDLAAVTYMYALELPWCPICHGFGVLRGQGRPCVTATDRGHGRPMLRELWISDPKGDNET